MQKMTVFVVSINLFGSESVEVFSSETGARAHVAEQQKLIAEEYEEDAPVLQDRTAERSHPTNKLILRLENEDADFSIDIVARFLNA